jgi:hypothetical protein
MLRRSSGLLCWLVLVISLPAAAEFYRWRDTAGREHFAQDLSRVPPQYRGAAKAAAERGADSAPVINYHGVPTRAPAPAGARHAVPAAPAPPSAVDCRALQKQVKKLEKVIRTHQGSVDANQRWADDIERSAFSRRKYELRAEEESRWLARAEAKLDRFRDAHRRKDTPPGCLR